MSSKLAITACISALLSSVVCNAAPLTNEYVVNTYTPGHQQVISQGTGANGDTAIMFIDTTRSNSGWVRRYDYAGNPFAAEYFYGYEPKAVGVDGAGNFGVLRDAPDGSSNGTFVAVYNRNGSVRIPEFRVNANTSFNQAGTNLAFNAQGYFAVAWQSYNGSAFQYFVKGFNTNGTAGTAELALPDLPTGLILDASRNITATGFSCTAGGCSIWMRKYNAYGTMVANISPLNTIYAGKTDVSPAITGTDAGGNAVVVWDRYDSATQRWTPIGQRLNGYGQKVGGEFGVTPSSSVLEQTFPSVTMRADGRFVVGWSIANGGVYARAFHADATPVSAEFFVGSTASGRAAMPLISTDPVPAYDNFTVSWRQFRSSTDTDVLARRFTMGVQ